MWEHDDQKYAFFLTLPHDIHHHILQYYVRNIPDLIRFAGISHDMRKIAMSSNLWLSCYYSMQLWKESILTDHICLLDSTSSIPLTPQEISQAYLHCFHKNIRNRYKVELSYNLIDFLVNIARVSSGYMYYAMENRAIFRVIGGRLPLVYWIIDAHLERYEKVALGSFRMVIYIVVVIDLILYLTLACGLVNLGTEGIIIQSSFEIFIHFALIGFGISHQVMIRHKIARFRSSLPLWSGFVLPLPTLMILSLFLAYYANLDISPNPTTFVPFYFSIFFHYWGFILFRQLWEKPYASIPSERPGKC